MAIPSINKIVARAPVRVDPAGGGTDAPPYCADHGGAVVNFSLCRHAYASLQLLPRGRGATLCSLDQKKALHVSSLEDLALDGHLDLLKAAVRRMMPEDCSFVLVTQSDVPERTGLGGSGAMGVALIAAMAGALGIKMSREAVALAANAIEREDLGFNGGSQDSYAAAYGGVKLITYRRGGGSSCEKLSLDPAVLRQLERDSLLVYTGGIHLSGTIHADIKASYALPDSPTVRAMDGLKQSALEMAEGLKQGDLGRYVECLNRSRNHHYALHSSCDSDALRRYFKELDPFIRGGKTCGAGGGGYILLMMDSNRRHECVERARELGGTPCHFTFDHEGAAVWEEPGFTADDWRMIEKFMPG